MKPSARVRGDHSHTVGEDNHRMVIVTTTVGDRAGSHSAAFAALKKAKIPIFDTRAGTIKILIDDDMELPDAVAVVRGSLAAGGVDTWPIGPR